ncbi:MAG: ABC transporter permease [Bacteroidota bacterium]
MEIQLSPSQLARRRFFRYRPAWFGLFYLGLGLLVSLFGYGLAPDKTTHANFQVLELAKQPPGYQGFILLIPKPEVEPRSWWKAWVSGQPAQFVPLALQSLEAIDLGEEYLRFTHLSGAQDSLPLDRFNLPAGKELSRQDFVATFTRQVTFHLGSDAYGRDLLSRILLGTRVSLFVGLMSVLISLSLGIFMGALAGYFGGWVDRSIMWLISVLWSIPTLLLALALAAVLGRGFWQLFVAIGVSMWVEVARLVRGQILALREQPFVEAAKALGYPSGRIMWKHILPNITSPIIVIAVANFGAAVLIESGLSFLGLGVEVPIPTWGRMVYEGYTYLVFEAGQWLAIYPGLALVLLIVSVNLIGIGLRDALDVKN